MKAKGINHLVKVSREDQDLLENYTWSKKDGSKSKINHLYYARNIRRKNGKITRLMMHRIIMERVLGRELETTEKVDHIDYDGLNNCRDNLRIVTVGQNIGRGRMRQNNTSGHQGVSWVKKSLCWRAQICHQGRVRGIGIYPTKEEAHTAYDAVHRFIRRDYL